MGEGKVFLVGAGPGDYQLITLKALRCLQRADTIIYDRLADDSLLSFTRRDAELIYVGKFSGKHTMPQARINALLVEKALEGKLVVRLKGGDPFVFGRGGEEALALAAENIRFEVVPGITSAIAVPGYAGIPVTQRGVATSFAVVTGHENPAKTSSTINWDKLATGVDTLVFLMGVENLEYISQKLMAAGRAPDTPAAIIEWGTRPDQAVVTTTVEGAAQAAATARVMPPAVFIVGEVVNLREKLIWFDNKPLHGKKIMVTRAREQAGKLIDMLQDLGAACIELPAIKIEPLSSYNELDEAIRALANYQWLIFTSANGVKYFFERLAYLGGDARRLALLKIAAIGTGTAECLKKFGIRADIVPVEFRAEGIVAALQDDIVPGSRVLIPRAQEAREVLPQSLTELGASVTVVPAYRTVVDRKAVNSEKLQSQSMDYVTFTSSSTVKNFLKMTGSEGRNLLARTKIACIGPITAATCVAAGFTPDVIAEPFTMKGLVEAIAKEEEKL